MGHPVAGLDDRRALAGPGPGQLKAILGLAEVDLLLGGGGLAVRRGGAQRGAVRKCHDVARAQPVNADGARDVLHRLLAEIGKGQRELVADLVVRRARDADAAGLAQRFEAGGDVDAVAENVVAVDDDVADIDADPEHDPLVVRNLRVAPGHLALNIDRAGDRIDDTGEFDQHAVAGGLDDAPAVFGDAGIDDLPAMRLQGGDRADLVGSHQAAVAGHVCGQYRGKPALHSLSSNHFLNLARHEPDAQRLRVFCPAQWR